MNRLTYVHNLPHLTLLGQLENFGTNQNIDLVINKEIQKIKIFKTSKEQAIYIKFYCFISYFQFGFFTLDFLLFKNWCSNWFLKHWSIHEFFTREQKVRQRKVSQYLENILWGSRTMWTMRSPNAEVPPWRVAHHSPYGWATRRGGAQW